MKKFVNFSLAAITLFTLSCDTNFGDVVTPPFMHNGLYYQVTDILEQTVEVKSVSSFQKDATRIGIPPLICVVGCYKVTSIGYSAFYHCSALTSITIPNSVTSIGRYAFEYCSALTSITIPNSVTSIGNSAFEGCSSLESIVVESGNTTYDSRNDCNAIIETATNTLIVGCKNTTIPNSVTSIGGGAFEYCSALTSITIPNSVTSIGGGAFYYCRSLIYITIPNSVTSIGNSAFYYCSSLISITFEGTIEQWNQVKKGDYWHNYVPTTTVHCTDGDVAI